MKRHASSAHIITKIRGSAKSLLLAIFLITLSLAGLLLYFAHTKISFFSQFHRRAQQQQNQKQQVGPPLLSSDAAAKDMQHIHHDGMHRSRKLINEGDGDQQLLHLQEEYKIVTTEDPQHKNKNDNDDSRRMTTPEPHESALVTERELNLEYPHLGKLRDATHGRQSPFSRKVYAHDVSLMLSSMDGGGNLRGHHVRSVQHFFPDNVVRQWRQGLVDSWYGPTTTTTTTIGVAEKKQHQKNETTNPPTTLSVRERMEKAVDAIRREKEALVRADDWVLATNNDGHVFGMKIMSRSNIPGRKKFAAEQYRKNPSTFMYAKWELRRDHWIHQAMKGYIDCPETRAAVCAILDSDCPKDFITKAKLGDFFVSLFEHDQFLTSHSDLSLGSITVVGHFLVDKQQVNVNDKLEVAVGDRAAEQHHNNNNNNNNDDEDPVDRDERMQRLKQFHSSGGETVTKSGSVQFFCADRKEWCVSLPVSMNELVVFRTQPDNAPHRVTMMTDERYLRFGLTGWFAMPGEEAELVY